MFKKVTDDLVSIGEVLSEFGVGRSMHSILGDFSSWRSGPYPEISLFESVDTGVRTMSGMMVQRVFPMREVASSVVQDRIEEYGREAWFFVNGITTNIPMLKLNGDYLKDLFKRPFELIYNPTDGVLVDVVECLLGRSFNMASEPSEYLSRRIEAALDYEDYERVVLIAHSQGTIIASNVIKHLLMEYEGDDRLSKLELYTFGCAADEMDIDEGLSRRYNRLVPYIEHFANKGDLVANLGILQKRKMQDRGNEYYGEIYELDRSGHYLNAHYLNDFKEQAYQSEYSGRSSRLYDSMDGGRPDYFNPLPAALAAE